MPQPNTGSDGSSAWEEQAPIRRLQIAVVARAVFLSRPIAVTIQDAADALALAERRAGHSCGLAGLAEMKGYLGMLATHMAECGLVRLDENGKLSLTEQGEALGQAPLPGPIELAFRPIRPSATRRGR